MDPKKCITGDYDKATGTPLVTSSYSCNDHVSAVRIHSLPYPSPRLPDPRPFPAPRILHDLRPRRRVDRLLVLHVQRPELHDPQEWPPRSPRLLTIWVLWACWTAHWLRIGGPDLFSDAHGGAHRLTHGYTGCGTAPAPAFRHSVLLNSHSSWIQVGVKELWRRESWWSKPRGRGPT